MSLPKPSSQIPVPIGRRGRWRGGGGGSPNRGTPSRGRIPPPNGRPKAQNFGGGLPPKFCSFGWSPSRPIGKLADGRDGMASDFQSAADPSDRRRLRIRGHPRTRGELLRRLGGSKAPRDAPPPCSARSWAWGERGALIGLNCQLC